jgi:surface polysaccharide O-acyltransferase-like enzyme
VVGQTASAPGFPEQVFARIALLRLPLAIGVVFAHAKTFDFADASLQAQASAAPVTFFIQVLTSLVLGKLSVPLYLMIGSFLFFRDWRPGLGCYAQKLSRRLVRLGLPYFFWNTLYLAVLLGLFLYAGRPQYFHRFTTFVSSGSIGSNLARVYGAGIHPLDYPLWFVRDLFCLFLLAPSWIWLHRHCPRLTLAALLAVFFIGLPGSWGRNPLFFERSFLFFYLGFWLIRAIPMLERFQRRWGWCLLGTFGLALLDAACIVGQSSLGWWVHRVFLLVGVGALWVLAGILANRILLSGWLRRWQDHSMTVFGAHALVLDAFRKSLLLGTGVAAPWIELPVYYLSVGVTVIACVAGSRMVHRVSHCRAGSLLALLMGIKRRTTLPRLRVLPSGRRVEVWSEPVTK